MHHYCTLPVTVFRSLNLNPAAMQHRCPLSTRSRHLLPSSGKSSLDFELLLKLIEKTEISAQGDQLFR